MGKESDLSNQWFEARRLREQSKEVVLNGGMPLVDRMEERLFEEADKRIDAYWAEKKGLVKQVIPEAPWEKDHHETEKIIFEAKERR
jgi:hypothetical protein